MKGIAVLILMMSISGSLCAQQSFIVGDIAYCSYSMSSMKAFQQNFVRNSGITYHTVYSFPSYVGYSAELGLAASKYSSLGVSISYNSTGGRMDNEDYSGKAYFDQLLTSVSFGGFYQHQMNRSEKWPLCYTFNVSYVRTNLDMLSQVQIGTINQEETLNAVSNNIGLRPGLRLLHNVGPVLFRVGIAYEAQIHGALHLSGQKDATLQDSNDEPVKAEWDGFRFSAGIGFLLKKGN